MRNILGAAAVIGALFLLHLIPAWIVAIMPHWLGELIMVGALLTPIVAGLIWARKLYMEGR